MFARADAVGLPFGKIHPYRAPCSRSHGRRSSDGRAAGLPKGVSLLDLCSAKSEPLRQGYLNLQVAGSSPAVFPARADVIGLPHKYPCDTPCPGFSLSAQVSGSPVQP